MLEVLQQGQHSRGGEHAGAGTDVRVIASSTVDLSAAMAQRVFLSSLYYYLKVIEIHVPPLRHRCQDIGPLAESYLAAANAKRARPRRQTACHFAQEALQCLAEYDWPGNKLQLASVVAHAVLLTDGDEITPMQVRELLGEVVPHDDAETISVPLIGGLKDIERTVVAAVIERCRGNKAEAARVLGLHRRELYRILQHKAAAKEDASSPCRWPWPKRRRLRGERLFLMPPEHISRSRQEGYPAGLAGGQRDAIYIPGKSDHLPQ